MQRSSTPVIGCVNSSLEAGLNRSRWVALKKRTFSESALEELMEQKNKYYLEYITPVTVFLSSGDHPFVFLIRDVGSFISCR